MAFLASTQKTTALKQSGARLVVMAAVLSTGILGANAAGAAGFESGARVSLEGLDSSATFVSFAGQGNSLPPPPQDLSVLLAQVETVLGEEVAVSKVPASPAEIQSFVAEAHALVGPIAGVMGGGALPNLAGLSLEGIPFSGLEVSGGGAPLALPGLEGLDAIQLGGALDGALGGPLGAPLGDGLGGGLSGGLPVGGVVDGVVGGVTGGLPSIPVVGGLLGQ